MGNPVCRILIIGGGLCGLGAAIAIALEGHQVVVFESAPAIHQVGAGIQITPNGLRLLRKWGVAEALTPKATAPETFSMIRYDGQRVLAHRDDYHEELKSRYGEPIWCLHRIDLQQALAQRAGQLDVQILFSSRVRHVDFERPAITCENGHIEEGDLVIAADGLWSSTRDFLVGRPFSPKPTGDLAYRIVLTEEHVDSDEELRSIMTPGIRIWMGPRAHAVAYSLLGGKMLNIVLLVPDDLPKDTPKARGDIGEIAGLFEGWDPILTKFLSHVKTVDKWRLMYLRLDEPWYSKQGTFVMAGDACHPILPYMAQGTNSAFEDGATLGALLGKLKSKSQIPAMMRAYDSIRKERTLEIRAETFRHQEELHLPDGEMQESRDRLLQRSFETMDPKDEW